MDQSYLPPELLEKLIFLGSIKDILSWRNTNTLINLICQDDNFWKDKVNNDYPNYVGSPYKNSYEETAILLYFGKYITNTKPNLVPAPKFKYHNMEIINSPLLVNGQTNFMIFPQGRNEYNLYTTSGRIYYINISSGNVIITNEEGREYSLGSKNTKLYTVILENNQNLLSNIAKITFFY